MLDEKTLRKKVFLRLLGHPLTVMPFMLGMTTMMATWAMNWQPGFGLFAGAAGLLAARQILGLAPAAAALAVLISIRPRPKRERARP